MNEAHKRCVFPQGKIVILFKKPKLYVVEAPKAFEKTSKNRVPENTKDKKEEN